MELSDFFNKLTIAGQDSEETPTAFICSGCMEVSPMPDLHALPNWNTDCEAIFMGNRCSKCWEPTLAETYGRLENWDSACRDAFLSFFDIWHFTDVAEEIRLLPDKEGKQVVERILDEVWKSKGILFNELIPGWKSELPER